MTTAPLRFSFLATGLLLALLTGCAGVKVSSLSTSDYLNLRRGDVLTTGELSSASRSALQVLGIDPEHCRPREPRCREALATAIGLSHERQLAALAELWLQTALHPDPALPEPTRQEQQVNAYLESARHAYAYLFLSERKPDMRALEDRQAQVRDYYNFATQEAVTTLFRQFRGRPPTTHDSAGNLLQYSGDWLLRAHMNEVRLANDRQLPQDLIPASTLTFEGLRNQYRRDGIGAELVAVTARKVVASNSRAAPFSETPFPAVTAVLHFPGADVDEVLSRREAHLLGYDPYRRDSIELAGVTVPLAANFTSGYGLWLARSGFAQQSLLTLIGRGDVLEQPHIYLMQPYDPNRKVIVMLHGLASSPEAWINVANEVLGDERLRQHYQIWQVYYPTNAPLAFNHHSIRTAIARTRQHFDPDASAAASRDMVIIGHSMGGVLARLLVSDSGDQLWNTLLAQYPHADRARQKIAPYLTFGPLSGINRAIFIAAPHRGTPFAEYRLARWISGLISVPTGVVKRLTDIAQLLVDPDSADAAALTRPLNSIDNLSSRDPFITATAALPIGAGVRYHSIIANNTPAQPLTASHDGLVPYTSAHLAGADSEKVLAWGHSVQENPEAIIEIRRILHTHLYPSETTAALSQPAQP